MKRISNRTSLFFLLAAISLVLLILSSSGRLAPVEGNVARLSQPFLTVSNDLGRQITNIINTARELTGLRTTNKQL
jgi:hypothetical protein